jgi:hypothetical protein
MVRADFQESSLSQWMARYNWGDDTQSNQGIGLAGSKTITNYKQWSLSNTRTLTPTLVNDARGRLHQVLQLDRHPLGLYQ